MNIRSRLSQLQSQAGIDLGSPARDSVHPNLQARLTSIRLQRQQSQKQKHNCQLADKALAYRLQGKQIAEGLIQIHKQIPLIGRLGKISLDCIHGKPVFPDERHEDNRRYVYIDTETTGLSGGSGTLAFLIGIARVDKKAIVLTQYLLSRFSSESVLLSSLADSLSKADNLVSYNGKSYDLPLLMARFRMQAIHNPLYDLPHLDLLPITRRLFAKRWQNCRLINLEQNLLGFRRIDDLPGAEAPSAWFNYIRHGSEEQLIKVVEHNQQDVISLVVAHHVLAQAIRQPLTFNIDLAMFARWLSAHDEDASLRFMERYQDSLCDEGKRFFAHLLKRSKQWSRAITYWEALAQTGCHESIDCLAKYHEHISKNLTLARYYCQMLPASEAQRYRHNRITAKLRRKQQMAF